MAMELISKLLLTKPHFLILATCLYQTYPCQTVKLASSCRNIKLASVKPALIKLTSVYQTFLCHSYLYQSFYLDRSNFTLPNVNYPHQTYLYQQCPS